MSAEPFVVRCEDLTHRYRDDEGTPVTALAEVELGIGPGETVGLIGPSGAGKSTLMTLLAGLLRPTSGQIRVAGQDVHRLSEGALLRFRAQQVGVMLQTPGRNLLPYATARQNVAFAQRSGDRDRRRRRERVDALLESVGLLDCRDRSARFLSGGQQQRLALAVALAGQPSVLLADEPTSQLDHDTGNHVLDLMLDTARRQGTALVVVTHDPRVADRLDTVYRITDGQLTREPQPRDGSP